ncbi:hypothetical protein BDW59DRAFT_166224 [Aspergillus cavernicola]|uniref:Uncharacterized protein n=1 Tax=Aspergillus cavernicola TaxID=176166 RepID=A0ABR4HMS6_9EURO
MLASLIALVTFANPISLPSFCLGQAAPVVDHHGIARLTNMIPGIKWPWGSDILSGNIVPTTWSISPFSIIQSEQSWVKDMSLKDLIPTAWFTAKASPSIWAAATRSGQPFGGAARWFRLRYLFDTCRGSLAAFHVLWLGPLVYALWFRFGYLFDRYRGSLAAFRVSWLGPLQEVYALWSRMREWMADQPRRHLFLRIASAQLLGFVADVQAKKAAAISWMKAAVRRKLAGEKRDAVALREKLEALEADFQSFEDKWKTFQDQIRAEAHETGASASQGQIGIESRGTGDIVLVLELPNVR